MTHRSRLLIWVLVALAIAGAGYLSIRFFSRLYRDERVTVVIDPGHPSETNSARHIQNGTSELEMNWQVGLRLQSELARDERIRVVRARETRDQFQRNRDRAFIGNREKAALIVHLHCDAGPSSGFTTYYPDRQGTSGITTGPSEDVIRKSHIAALAVHQGMASILSGNLRDRGVKGEAHTYIGSRRGALTTSIYSEVPTVTIEMVFLSNRRDAEFIKSEMGQRLMTAAIARGIRNYLSNME